MSSWGTGLLPFYGSSIVYDFFDYFLLRHQLCHQDDQKYGQNQAQSDLMVCYKGSRRSLRNLNCSPVTSDKHWLGNVNNWIDGPIELWQDVN